MGAKAMQVQTETHLTHLPAKPHCIPFYNGSPCDVAMKNYNQAVRQWNTEQIQLYVNQHALVTDEATASLQQIPLAEASASAEGVLQGAMFGFGAALVLFAISYGIKQLFKTFNIRKKPQARAASA
jgi:hypothetical protein